MVMASTAYSGNKYIKNIVNDFERDSLLSTSLVGVKVYNITNKKEVYSYNSTKSFTPASVLKLLTTSAALEILGEDFRFKTIFAYRGNIVDGVLNGDLYVIGGGDPSLGSKYLYKNGTKDVFINKWINKLKSKGINRINGNIIVNNSIFSNRVPFTWVWGDIGNHYGSPAYGLSYSDNIYNIYFKSGKAGELTSILDVEPKIAKEIHNEVYASVKNRDLAYLYAAPNSRNILIKGTIPCNKKRFRVKGSVPAPSLILGNRLHDIITSEGVVVGGKVLSSRDYVNYKIDTLDIHYSHELKDIVRVTNTESNNLFAEHLLNYLGFTESGIGDEKSGIERVKRFYSEKIGSTHGMLLHDGCGLSSFNAITPNQIMNLLLYMNNSKSKESFLNSLAIAGKTGTFSYMWRNTFMDNNFVGKSGSFEGVRTYAGYYNNKKGDRMAVVIMVNNYACKASYVRKKLEKIILKIGEN